MSLRVPRSSGSALSRIPRSRSVGRDRFRGANGVSTTPRPPPTRDARRRSPLSGGSSRLRPAVRPECSSGGASFIIASEASSLLSILMPRARAISSSSTCCLFRFLSDFDCPTSVECSWVLRDLRLSRLSGPGVRYSISGSGGGGGGSGPCAAYSGPIDSGANPGGGIAAVA